MKKLHIAFIIFVLISCIFAGCNIIPNIPDNYVEPDEDSVSEIILPTVEPSKTNAPAPSDVQPAEIQTPKPSEEQPLPSHENSTAEKKLPEDGEYNSKDDVALYIHQYGKLPSNYITKREAQELGWEGGSVENYAPKKSLGGSRFGNYEGLLPEKKGRLYTECDIDTIGKRSRGAKRIVFSNDGLIYYTDDHYESFILLYGEEKL